MSEHGQPPSHEPEVRRRTNGLGISASTTGTPKIDPTADLLIRTAEEAHEAGDIFHVALISFHLSVMGYHLSDPEQIYGRPTCPKCGERWKVIHEGRLRLSRCCA